MKLKLEIQDGTTILSITESVTRPQIPILKAGLAKLFQSGKTVVLLDLTGLDQGGLEGIEVHQEIAAFPAAASEAGAQLVIASTIEGVGNAPNREEALKLLASPLAKLLGLEASLKAQVETLTRQKEEAAGRLGSAGEAGDIKELRKENSDLKSLVASLEEQIRNLLQSRADPFESTPQKAKLQSLHKILTAVLEQEGILPIT